MIPWAIDDLIISDDVLWQSALKDVHGLPQAGAQLAERFGRWPAFGGLARPGRRLNLVTLWNHTTHALRAAAKRQFEQYASPEREVIRRLSVVDSVVPGVAPSSVLLALGPWDVARSGSTYAPRDLTDDASVATVSGGVIWRPGRFGMAYQAAEATTNLIGNPQLYANSTGFTARASPTTLARDTSTFYIGVASLHVVADSASDGLFWVDDINFAASTEYTLSVYMKGTGTVDLSFYDLVGGYQYGDTLTLTSTWTRYTLTRTFSTGTARRICIRSVGATADWYCDAFQMEAKAWPTPYCDGSLGPGHSWSGTTHASTSARTAASCVFTNPVSTVAGSVCLWWKPSADYNGPLQYFFNEGNLRAYFYATDDKIVFTDGTNPISTAALTFSAETWMHLVFTWSSSGMAIYINGASAATGATYTAPTAGASFYLGRGTGATYQTNGLLDYVSVLGVALTAAQAASLYAAQLAADWKARWCNVIAEEVKAFAIGGEETDQGVVSTLAMDGDVRWRSRDGAAFWRLIAGTGSCVVNNDGDDDAYPLIYITPKTAKTGDTWAYKVWNPIKWLAASAGTSYPVEITEQGLDAGNLVSASKMQADYDDLRVKVDGVEVNRWLSTVVIEDCEDAWNESVDADFTVTTPAGKIGTCNKFAIAAGASAGDKVTEAVSSLDLNGFSTVYAWVKCSVNTAAGNFQLLLDNTANCASPLETINIPALTANTWTRVALTLANPATDLAIISVGIKYTVDIGACDFYIDDVRTVTKVWANLDFQASQTATMAAIADAVVTTITATTDISGWPSTGILYIETEAITYTGRNVTDKTFTGCTRGAKGTTAAAHAAALTAYWIQHDIWILYGNASAAAPTVDSNYEPAFELDHSTNTSWVYEEFGEDDGLRSASWAWLFYYNWMIVTSAHYTANQNTNASPWSEVGLSITPSTSVGSSKGVYYLYNPCGVTNANFTNGEYNSTKLGGGSPAVGIQSSVNATTWVTEYAPAMTHDTTWRAWSQNQALTAGSKYVGLYVYDPGYADIYGEAADCAVTLNSTYTPVVVIGAEQSNYDLAVTLTNSTTGDSIALALTMQLNQTLEIDTDAKTVTLLADNSKQMQALTFTGGARRDWLRLATGNNTLTWSDTGTVSVEVEILFDRRYFE